MSKKNYQSPKAIIVQIDSDVLFAGSLTGDQTDYGQGKSMFEESEVEGNSTDYGWGKSMW